MEKGPRFLWSRVRKDTNSRRWIRHFNWHREGRLCFYGTSRDTLSLYKVGSPVYRGHELVPTPLPLEKKDGRGVDDVFVGTDVRILWLYPYDHLPVRSWQSPPTWGNRHTNGPGPNVLPSREGWEMYLVVVRTSSLLLSEFQNAKPDSFLQGVVLV